MHDQWQKLDELVIAWMQEQSDFQHKCGRHVLPRGMHSFQSSYHEYGMLKGREQEYVMLKGREQLDLFIIPEKLIR